MRSLRHRYASTTASNVWNTVTRFRKGTRGLAAVEFALLLPFYMAVMFGGYIAFDNVRNRDNVELATDVVADMMSRATELDTDDLDELQAFHTFLSRLSAGAVSMEVVAVQLVNDDKNTTDPSDDELRHAVRWRYDSTVANKNQRSTPPAPSGGASEEWFDDQRLPNAMAENEMAFLMEIDATMPTLKIGRYSRLGSMRTNIVTFPRFTSTVDNPDA